MSLSTMGSIVRRCTQMQPTALTRVWMLQGYGRKASFAAQQCVQHEFAESYVRVILALGTKNLAGTHPAELKELNALYTHAIHTQDQNQEVEGQQEKIKMRSDRIFPHEVLATNTFSGSDISPIQNLTAAEAKTKYIELTRKIIGY